MYIVPYLKYDIIKYHRPTSCDILYRPGTVNALAFWLEFYEPRLPGTGLLDSQPQVTSTSAVAGQVLQWNPYYQQAVHLLRSPLHIRANETITFHCTLWQNGHLSCDFNE